MNCMNKIYGHRSYFRRFNAYFLAGSCPLRERARKDPQLEIHFPDVVFYCRKKCVRTHPQEKKWATKKTVASSVVLPFEFSIN